MAEPLDVAARLAEGRPSVDNIGDYVWACHLLGYQNPDLTLHAAQVRDWYSSEDGLDLRALDADRAALDAVAQATEGAWQLQDQQLGALAAAWQGRGGDASQEFLRRHGEASATAASAVRDAADALTALRDDLWHAVDGKVAEAVAIDDRRVAERPEWLAATQTVTTGAGDRAVASELIDQQVKPFVDNDIRSDWLTAMQNAMTAVAAAFDAATGVLTGEHEAMFEVPGDLGPLSTPAPVSPAPEVAGTAPANWPAPAPTAAPGMTAMTAPPPAFVAPPEPVAAPMAAAPVPAATPAAAPPAMPSFGELGGGLPSAAGGLAGLGTQLADAIGGLLNQPDGSLPDPPDPKDEPKPGEDPAPGDKPKPGEDPAPGDKPKPDEEPEPADKVDDEPVPDAEEPVDACTDTSADETPPVEPAPTPPPAPMPPQPEPIVEPPPNPGPVHVQTPCEIAADELPQAGA